MPGTAPGAFVSSGHLDDYTSYAESRTNPNAVSPKGARGIMQVMPSTARDPGFGIRPSDGSQADEARVGREYRAKMQGRYGGNLPKMWGAYNAGPGRVDGLVKQYGDAWLDHAPRETQDYVTGLMRRVRGK